MAKHVKPNTTSKPKPTWFTKGEQAARKLREQAKTAYTPEFWMKDGETAKVIFLDKEPFNISLHKVEIRGRLRNYTCIGKGCPLCRGNFKGSNTSFVSVYRIIDLRTFAKKDDPASKSPPKQKYLLASTMFAPIIAKQLAKKRVYRKVVEIDRTGTQRNTTYQLTYIGEINEVRKQKLGALLTTITIDPEKDFVPKSRSELLDVAAQLGAVIPDEDEDDDEQTNPKDYLDDDDDDVSTDDAEDTDDEDEDDDAVTNGDGADDED